MPLAQVYPFATQDGKAIPLDIIKSAGLIVKSFSLTAELLIFPEDKPVGMLIASKACVLRMGQTLPDTLSDAVEYSDTILLPTNMAVICALTAGAWYVKGLTETGTLYVQFIEKWVGLALDRQFIRK